MEHAEPIAALEEGRQAVRVAFSGMIEDAVSRRAPDGGWNAWEIAYHLLDIERWYIAKLCEAAMPDRAAALAHFVAVWGQVRSATIALARAVPQERLDRAGLLTGVPDWTPGRLLDAITAHDHEHAAQVWAARRLRLDSPRQGAP